MTQSAFPEPLPRELMRAADADRQATVDELRRAHDDGRIDLAEFDERVRSAYAARTYADLAQLTVDLPDARHTPVGGGDRGVPAAAASAPPGPSARPAPWATSAPSGPWAASARWASPAPFASSAPSALAGRDVGGLVWRIVGSAWFSVSLINIMIWGIICLATTDLIYPWWIWVSGPWGAMLLAGWLSGFGRSKRGR